MKDTNKSKKRLINELNQARSKIQELESGAENSPPRNVLVELLDILYETQDLQNILKKVTRLMKEWSGCSAVGIRLKKDDDYPYFETRGFSKEFVKLENSLCARDQEGEKIRNSEGNPVLECMCGNVIYGRYDPNLPFFTEKGSFWTNSTTELLASTDEEDRQSRTRDTCNGEGYESVALIPLRFNDEPLGLLQFNHLEKGYYNTSMIAQMEKFAASLSMAIAERRSMYKLSESERKFKTLFNNMSDAVVVHKLETLTGKPGKIKMFNQVACELSGYNSNEIEELNPFDIEKEESRFIDWEELKQTLREERQANFETTIVTKSGQKIIVEVNSNVFELKNDSMVISIIRDITEKRKIQQKLKENKIRYQALYENAPLPYQSLDKDGQIVDVNPEWLRSLGYFEEDVLGRKFTELLHPDNLTDFKTNFSKFIERGEIHNVQYRLLHSNGHYINVEIDGYIGYNSEGEFNRTYCVFREITEEKRLKETLKKTENRYRNLIKASINHMFMLNPEGYFMLSNDRVEQFGLEKGSQLVGRSVMEVYDLELGKFYEQKIDEVIAKEASVTFEHTLETKNDTYYHLDTLYPIIKDEEIWAIGGICRDITERKKAEIQLRQTLKHLSEVEEEFRKKASQKLHDHVGQNLTALIFNLDYIQNNLPSDLDKLIYKKLNQSKDLLDNTIERIRNIISEIRPSVLEDYGLFAALKWYGNKFSKRMDIAVKIVGEELQERLPESIETAIFRIIQEIFNNIAKHARAEKVLIRLEEKSDYVNIFVHDDGVGFDIDQIKEHPNSTESTGWGIVSMGDRIKSIGGEFGLISQPGQGTKIKIKMEK